EVFPVNYALGEGTVVFRTGEGDKLAELTVYPDIAFEVDHVGDTEAWSVVLHGRARTLIRFDEIAKAEELDLHSWAPGEKYNFVVIDPTELTGRKFVRSAE
ncbi:MAG: pyridoxamine 5'-phosphate oxidase family protein, partial [Rhodococcus sp.]|nr:pyridoxamine 5'-phosphate oxidase family protein [Rhodococcus sp. (in: high G+C Gram-positive bacteria)]